MTDGGKDAQYGGGSPFFNDEEFREDPEEEPVTDGGYEEGSMRSFHENYVESSPAQDVFE